MTRILATLVSRLNRWLQARSEAKAYRAMLRRFPLQTRVCVARPCSDCAKYNGKEGVIDSVSTDTTEYRVEFDGQDAGYGYFKPDELERVQ